MASGACARVKSHCLPFTDPNGDEVKIEITDNQILELAEVLNEKAESILESRKEQEVE